MSNPNLPEKHEVEKFLAVTRSYSNLKETMDEVSNYHTQFRNVREKNSLCY